MALSVGSLFATLGIRTSGFDRGLNNAEGRFNGLAKKMKGIGAKMTIGVSAPLAALGAKSFGMAADMTESINKVDTVFQDNAETVHDWASTTLNSIGIAKGEAMEMASLFGDMGTSMGQSTAEATDMSTELVNLAGDLSSFKNISAERAQSALTGIYTGETEALKGLGIIMTQANLKAFAMSKGIQKNFEDMTEAEKVQLRYQYVMEKTANAQGDFARTSDSASNQLRQMKGALSEAGAELGMALIPLLVPFIQKLTEIVKWFGSLSDGTKKWVVGIGMLLVAIGPIIGIVGSAISIFGKLKLVFVAVRGFMMASLLPTLGTLFTTIGGALVAAAPFLAAGAAIIGIGVLIYKNWDKIVAGAKQLWANIKQIWARVVGVVQSAAQSIKSAWSSAVSSISSTASRIWGIITSPFQRAWGFIKGIFNNIKSGLAGAFNFKIPKIKLPHFKISGKLSINPPRIPKLGISWYKNGGMFDNPTLAGLGEAGKEAVVPFSGISSRRIGEAIAGMIPTNQLAGGVGETNIVVNLNGYNKSPQELAKEISRIQYRMVNQKNRTRGR
jgi:hypothetical protein